MKEHSTERPDQRPQVPERNRISSTDLAALVIDALLRAGIVEPEDARKAMRIAAEEIEVRKALGDY